MAINKHGVRGLGILAVFTIISVVPTSNAAAQVEVPDQVLAWNLHAYNGSSERARPRPWR
jgi:hypothetical protein